MTFFLKKIYCGIIHNRLLSVYVKKEFIFDYFWENDSHMSVPQNFLTKVWNFENFIKSVFWLFFWKKLYRDIIHNCLLSVYVKKEFILYCFWENDSHMSVPQNFLTKIWKFHKKCFLKKLYRDIIHNCLLSVYVKKEFILYCFWENDSHMSVPQNFLTKTWNFENFIKSVFWLFFEKNCIVT